MTRKSSIPVVLEVIERPEPGSTRYVDQVVDFSQRKVAYEFFSWKKAFIGKYDVLHIHWPEKILRHPRASVRVVKRILARILLLSLRAKRVPIVRTLHNVQPHETGDRSELRLLNLIDARTACFVRINEISEPPVEGRPLVTIPHADYREQYDKYDRVTPIPGHMVHFGHMRPYKGIEALLAAFDELAGKKFSLRLVGEVKSDSLEQVIVQASQRNSRITAQFGFLEDSQLAHEIMLSQIVVLPYENMHNSGALLLALSLDRPVLAPSSPVNLAIAEEVGAGWLYLYDGKLSPSVLEEAFKNVVLDQHRRLMRPNLSQRDVTAIRQQYTQLFDELTHNRTTDRRSTVTEQ